MSPKSRSCIDDVACARTLLSCTSRGPPIVPDVVDEPDGPSAASNATMVVPSATVTRSEMCRSSSSRVARALCAIRAEISTPVRTNTMPRAQRYGGSENDGGSWLVDEQLLHRQRGRVFLPAASRPRETRSLRSPAGTVREFCLASSGHHKGGRSQHRLVNTAVVDDDVAINPMVGAIVTRRVKSVLAIAMGPEPTLHSTLNSCCGNDVESAVMKSRLIFRSTRRKVRSVAPVAGSVDAIVIPRCGHTHRNGARKISRSRIGVIHHMFALQRGASRQQSDSSWGCVAAELMSRREYGVGVAGRTLRGTWRGQANGSSESGGQERMRQQSTLSFP